MQNSFEFVVWPALLWKRSAKAYLRIFIAVFQLLVKYLD
jgi:hypothetical protein